MLRNFTVAFPGGPSSSDQQHQIGIAFSWRRSRHTQELVLEATRGDSNSASRGKVDVVELGEGMTKKAEV